jgi:hypothetical protein
MARYRRYDYSHWYTRDAAERCIEHMFANGEVSESEYPMVEKRWSMAAESYRYVVTLQLARGCV